MRKTAATKRPNLKAWIMPIAFLVLIAVGCAAGRVDSWVREHPGSPSMTIYRIQSLLAIAQLVGLGAVLGYIRSLCTRPSPAEDKGLMPVFVASQCLVILQVFQIFQTFFGVGLSPLVSVYRLFSRVYTIAAVFLGYTGMVLWHARRASGHSIEPAPQPDIQGIGKVL